MGHNETLQVKKPVRSSLFPELFRFHLENVFDDPIFGSATGLAGEIPFLRPAKPFIEFRAQLEADPRIVDRIGREIVATYRDLWPDLDDDSIFSIVRDQAFFLLLIFGPHWSPACDLARRDQLVKLVVLTFGVDAIFDKGGADAIPALDTYDYPELMAKFRAMDNPDVSCMPSGLAQLEMLTRMGRAAHAESEKIMAGFDGLYPKLKDDVISIVTAHMVTFEQERARAAGGELHFSEETLSELRRGLSGFKQTLGFAEFFKGIDVDESIRQDDLFRLMMNRAADIIVVQNGLLGLKRDVTLGQIDSPITCAVVHGGATLQEAFDASHKKIHRLYHDYVVASRKLVQLYKREPQVETYVEFLDSYLDGWLFVYKVAKRYGVHNRSEIVPNSDFAS